MGETPRKLTVTDLFPRRFVRGQDLRGPILAQLTGIGAETVHPRPGVEEQAHAVYFEHLDPKTRRPAPLRGFQRGRDGYAIILRRTLAEQIMAATGAETIDDWPGRVVVFEPATVAGKVTIKARAPRAPAGGPAGGPASGPASERAPTQEAAGDELPATGPDRA